MGPSLLVILTRIGGAMPTTMTPRQRLLATLRGDPTDRVPVSLYEIDGFTAAACPDHASYGPIRETARRRLDNMVFCGGGIPGPMGFLMSAGGEDLVTRETHVEGDSRVTTTRVRTPKGPLQTVTRRNPATYTTWTTEYLLKGPDDVDRLLSLPYQRAPVDISNVRAVQEKVGDRGIPLVDIGDPIGAAGYLMEFQALLELVAFDRVRVRALLDWALERMLHVTESLLGQGAGPLFRVCGAEFATPPYMRPDDFRALVVDYDRPLFELIHDYGQRVRLHCHGNLRQVLDLIMELEPDALDPVEGPPGGDITLGEVKRAVGDSICLMGNIQESMFELATERELRDEVRRTLDVGAPGGRFVLLPTATPITVPLPTHVERNLFAYVDEALNYGA